jgi:hypothetical protein
MIVNPSKCAYRTQTEYLMWMDLTLPYYITEKGCEECTGVPECKSCFINLESLIELNERGQDDFK